MSDKISWTASMVYKLLTSYVYTGATVGHKRKSGGVGSRKTISQEKEDWIIVEGMHEAIVSKEEFELAQAVIRGGAKKPKRNPHYYPLKGLVCCGNCKRALTRRKLRNEGGYFYQCTHSTHDRDTECPVGERYSEAWIENTAYNAIGQMLALVEKKAVKEHEISKRRKSAISECADTIRDLQKQSEQLKGVKLRLYEKYTSASITKAEYLKRKAGVDAKITENEEAVRQGHERMQELDSEHPCSDERLDKVVGEFQKCEGLTYELAHARSLLSMFMDRTTSKSSGSSKTSLRKQNSNRLNVTSRSRVVITYERLVKSQKFFSSYLTQEDLSRMGRTKFSISKYLFQ